MALRTTALALAAVTAALYLSSYSSGPAGSNGVDATSSGFGRQACGSCHRGGDYGTATALQLLDEAGEAVDAYRPGQTYTVRLDIGTSTAPGGYGFQVLALLEAARTQAGTFGEAPANTSVTELGGRSYFEHRRRLSAATHEIEWTAPEAGSGAVVVYAVGNAVNGTGGTSGDEVDEAVVTFPEAAASALAEMSWPAALRHANPAPGELRLWSTHGATAGEVTVASIGGRTYARSVLAKAAPLTVRGLPPGLYAVRLRDGEGRVATRLLPVLR